MFTCVRVRDLAECWLELCNIYEQSDLHIDVYIKISWISKYKGKMEVNR